MNDFSIRHRRSWRRWRWWWLLLLPPPLLLLIYLEKMHGGWGFTLPWKLQQAPSVRGLLDENARFKEQLLALEQNNQVDKQAVALLQQQLIDSQEENFRLRKDLEFYQGIMAAESDRNTPVIHGLRVKPLAQRHSYRLELILLQVTNKDRLFEGVLDIVVAGALEGETKRLPLRGLSLDRNSDYAVRFRNFLRFENNFTLPAGFDASAITVSVSAGDQEDDRIEQVFDWPATARGETDNVG